MEEIQFNFTQTIPKQCLMLTLCPNYITIHYQIVAFEIAAEVLKGLWNNFYYFGRCRKSSENHQTYSEVAQMFLENLVMTE